MKRTLVLLDVTAMAGDAVCVAGIDLETTQQTRLNAPQPTTQLLARYRGLSPLDVITVDCTAIARVAPPHVEDVAWLPSSLIKTGCMTIGEALASAQNVMFPSVRSAFGEPSITGARRNSAWQPGMGARSLACVRVRNLRFQLDARNRLRVSLADQAGADWASIPFQDITVRAHQSSCDPCEEDYLRTIRQEFAADSCIARLGLTRPFAPDNEAAACWLQVTNIFAKPRSHFT